MKRVLAASLAWLALGAVSAAAPERAVSARPIAAGAIVPAGAVEAPDAQALSPAAAAEAASALAVPAAQAEAQAWRSIGEAIQGRTPLQTLGEAGARLSSLGVLAPGDAADPVSLREAAQRLWYHAAPGTPRLFPVDDAWPVPALKVVSGPSTYYVHGVAHAPSLNWPSLRRSEVRSLVARARERGEPLVSELNLPAAYSFDYGVEVVDDGPSVSQRPAFADAVTGGVQRAWLAAKWALAAAPAALAAAAPERPSSWVALGAGWAAAYLIQRSFAPLRRAAYLWNALVAAPYRAAGWRGVWLVARRGGETARHVRRWAAAAYAPRLDLDALRRLQLPVALSSGGALDHGRRARALAAAAAAAAARAGKPVHVLTGFQHADEIAAHLAHD